MAQAKASVTVPKGLQTAFMSAVTIYWVAQIGMLVYMVLSQAPTNQNFSAFALPLFWAVGVPLIALAIAWFMAPRTLSHGARLFQAFLIGVSGVLLIYAAAGIIRYLPLVITSDYTSGVLYEISIAVLLVGAYAVVLAVLRRAKRWS